MVKYKVGDIVKIKKSKDLFDPIKWPTFCHWMEPYLGETTEITQVVDVSHHDECITRGCEVYYFVECDKHYYKWISDYFESEENYIKQLDEFEYE